MRWGATREWGLAARGRRQSIRGTGRTRGAVSALWNAQLGRAGAPPIRTSQPTSGCHSGYVGGLIAQAAACYDRSLRSAVARPPKRCAPTPFGRIRWGSVLALARGISPAGERQRGVRRDVGVPRRAHEWLQATTRTEAGIHAHVIGPRDLRARARRGTEPALQVLGSRDRGGGASYDAGGRERLT